MRQRTLREFERLMDAVKHAEDVCDVVAMSVSFKRTAVWTAVWRNKTDATNALFEFLRTKPNLQAEYERRMAMDKEHEGFHVV
jgi:hypothetical protein